MINFLFWNIKKNPIENFIVEAAMEHNIDILILAECELESTKLLRALNTGSVSYHYLPGRFKTKIEIFSKYPEELLIPKSDDNDKRFTIRSLELPGIYKVNIAAAHLMDRFNNNEGDLAERIRIFVDKIKLVEELAGHSNTLIVGDLNINPFEEGATKATCLNGVMSRRIALQNARKISGIRYRYFYNPMWSLLGDASPGPPGTFYFRDSNSFTQFFWHTLDQLMLRPSLLDFFYNKDLKILDTVGEKSLLTSRGIPNGNISDHLPIMFRLNKSRR